MKGLIIILLFPIAGLGQSEKEIINSGYSALAALKISPLPNPVMDTPYIKKGMTLLYSGTTTSIPPTMDTAIVMIVYCDTTQLTRNKGSFYAPAFRVMDNDFDYIPFIFWQFGYEVTQKTLIRGMPMQEPYYRMLHIAYLDQKKKPLSKSIVVIISIKL